MNTPKSDRPPKHMRIGTRSCAECRRRKVRCIFGPNSGVCQECAVHDTPCTAQQPRHTGKGHVDKGSQANVQKKLEELEGMVRRICKAVDLNIESSSLADFETSATEALKRLRPTPSLETRAEEYASMVNTSSNQTDRFEDAPLLTLFKDAMLIQKNDVEPDRDGLEPSTDQRIKTCIKALNVLIPSLNDLTLIFELTEMYWPIWSVSPKGLGVASARDFILDSFKSGRPAVVAKSVLWLALCVQQLPEDFKCKYQHPDLLSSPKALVDSYMNGAESLLSVDENSCATIEGLECLSLQGKLYINMGKPLKAWLSVRRALDFALLLGLHRPENNIEKRHKAIWAQTWQNDRLLSLILGFPYAIAESHPGLAKEHAGQSVEEWVMHEFSIITGHVIDRNQNRQNVDYSVTVQIGQELEQLRNKIPLDWWDAILTPATPFPVLYSRQVIKLHYYQLHTFLHLPYMLKPSLSSEFMNSRISTLQASREMLGCYQTVRNSNRGGPGSTHVICDLMDFLIFNAAMVLVINLLSSPSSPQRDLYHQEVEAEDWQRIHDITKTLNHVSRTMECTVAAQAAQLLQYFSMVRQGTYAASEGYSAVIPYFGKIRISPGTITPPNNLQHQIPMPQQAHPFSSPTIELSTNLFNIPFTQFPSLNNPSMTDHFSFSETELGIDWTSAASVFDAGGINQNYDYDWNQLFDNISTV
ncbi:MAG: hypothetical protein M1834_001256 [Cirrosporium novae-zelandiae]|nr:MAG: hypothetical protein M1834_001256 [Cirrosporium novae-zelandiae]